MKKRFVLQAAAGAINRVFRNYTEAVEAYRHTQYPKTLLSIDENAKIKVVYSHG